MTNENRVIAFTFRLRVKAFFRQLFWWGAGLLAPFQPVSRYRKWSERALQQLGIHRQVLEVDGFHIVYWKGGKGPVLLMLHGFNNDAVLSYHVEMRALCKQYTVVVPDLLWFGESFSNHEPNVQTQRLAIEALLRSLKVSDFSLLGQSYGGFLALDLVCSNPELRIDKVCFANCPGPVFDKLLVKKVCQRFLVNQLHELFVIEDHRTLQRLLDLVSMFDTRIPNKMLQQMFVNTSPEMRMKHRALMNDLLHREVDPSVLDRLNGMDCCVVMGAHDELFFLSEGEKFAKAINAELLVLPHSGHAPQFDDRRSFVRTLKVFFCD
jgi:pimeloyl-ACP methyl ester carboxylesterase